MWFHEGGMGVLGRRNRTIDEAQTGFEIGTVKPEPAVEARHSELSSHLFAFRRPPTTEDWVKLSQRRGNERLHSLCTFPPIAGFFSHHPIYPHRRREAMEIDPSPSSSRPPPPPPPPRQAPRKLHSTATGMLSPSSPFSERQASSVTPAQIPDNSTFQHQLLNLSPPPPHLLSRAGTASRNTRKGGDEG